MKHYLLAFVILLVVVKTSNSQVTLKINKAHHLTPLTDDLYLAGDFNNWNEKDPAYKFTRSGFNTFEITFNPAAPGTINYKVTRGAWANVEANANGTYLANRSFNYTGASTTISIQIDGWEDIGGINQTTAQSNTHILDLDFSIPQLNRTRRVWIYLPPDYHTSTKKYPVLYMHDGQNLFDNNYASFGEWSVDETLNDLHSKGDYGIIIVGIDHGGVDRLNEYSPWVNNGNGGGQGDEYVSFLVNTLKPNIDNSFRTLTQPEFTGILGSSMGGLISQYGAVEYQQTFKKVGLMSPAFWFSKQIFPQISNKKVASDMKFYFVSGTTESSSMVPLMQQVRDSLLNNGLPSSRAKLVTFTDGQHSEWFWAREFGATYQWLFSDLGTLLSMSTQTSSTNSFVVYPNPATETISIKTPTFVNQVVINLFDSQGKVALTKTFTGNINETINVSSLTKGIYFLQSTDAQTGESLIKKVLIQ